MNKVKYIERSTPYRHSRIEKKYRKLKHRNCDNTLLPYKESMRKRNSINKLSWDSYWYSHGFINFRHVDNFLMERIGHNWNNVYSELLSKIRKDKYKYEYRIGHSQWAYFIETNFFLDENDVPVFGRGYGHLRLFVDERNEIAYYETKEEMYLEYGKRNRAKKLQRLLDLIDIEDEGVI